MRDSSRHFRAFRAAPLVRLACRIFAGAAILLSLLPKPAGAQPAAVLGNPTLANGAATAVYIQGTEFSQVAIVADQNLSLLRFVSIPLRLELGIAFVLPTGCQPEDLLAVGNFLYVACFGIDRIDVLDLSAFSLSFPLLTRPASVPNGIATGDGPNRLIQLQSGSESLLAVQNATAGTVSIFSLSSTNAPIGINADDSTEAPNKTTPPQAVDVCGTAAPVGLGVGTERFYAGCSDGTLSYFNPFAGGDFSAAGTVSGLGPTSLMAAIGLPGLHGLWLQLADGRIAVADVRTAETGGEVLLQALYATPDPQTYVQGPTNPRGLLPFFDTATGQQRLAAWGAPAAGTEFHLFLVDDLDDPSYTPPSLRLATHTVSTGLPAYSGTLPSRGTYGGGNFYLPTRGAALGMLTAGPVFSFTTSGIFELSNLPEVTDPLCPLIDQVSLDWTTNEDIEIPTFEATLYKTTDPAYALGDAPTDANDGTVTIDAGDVSDLPNVSEPVVLRLRAEDSAGNVGVVEYLGLMDGIRPSLPAGLSGLIVDGILYLDWSAALDAGLIPSGISSYFVKITRTVPGDAGSPFTLDVPVDAAETSYQETADDLFGSDPPFEPDDVLEISIASCDAAGNRSSSFSTPITVQRGALGGAGALGETGGCGFSQNAGFGGATLCLAAASLLFALNRFRRKRGNAR